MWKKYAVQFSEIYLAKISPIRDPSILPYDSDDDIELCKYIDNEILPVNSTVPLDQTNEPEVRQR